MTDDFLILRDNCFTCKHRIGNMCIQLDCYIHDLDFACDFHKLKNSGAFRRQRRKAKKKLERVRRGEINEDLTEEVRRAFTIAVDSLDMWDKVVKEIKDNKPSSIDIELNGIERVGFAVGLNKAIEIIEKYRKEKRSPLMIESRVSERKLCMNRYKPINENRKDTINDIYGNELGNFFLCISVKNYNAKVEMCGDVSCGIPAMFDTMYEIAKKSGFNDKEKLIKIMDKVWEEKDDTKSGDN